MPEQQSNNESAIADFRAILESAREVGMTNGQRVIFNISPAMRIESVEYISFADGGELSKIFKAYRGSGEIQIKLLNDVPHRITVMRRKEY